MIVILGLTFAMIFIFIAVNLVPLLQGELAETAAEGGEVVAGSAATSSLSTVIPILFCAVLILGMLRMMMAFGGDTRSGNGWRIRLEGVFGMLPNTFITRQVYIRRRIGIGMAELAKRVGVTMLYESRVKDVGSVGIEPMELDIGRSFLKICDNYKWYITGKHPNYEMYKLVGLHRKRRGLNCVYLAGRDSHTGQPYILRCPPKYAGKSVMSCVRWNIGVGKGDILEEV